MSLIYAIEAQIVNPIVVLLFVIAVLYFIWGVYRLWIAGSPEEHAQGSRHVLGGLIGIIIMIAVFTIIQFIVATINPNGSNPNITVPSTIPS